MMALTWLGVSLGECECFPLHGSYQTPSNPSSSSLPPPSPGSSDCKPHITHPMSFIHLHTHRAALSHLSKGSGGALEVHRSLSSIPQIPDLFQSTWWHRGTAVSTSQPSATQLWIYSAPPHHHELPKSLGRSLCVTNPIQPGTRAVLSSPLCSSSLVLLCQRVRKVLVAQSKDSRETPRHILCMEAEGMELISWRREPLGGPQSLSIPAKRRQP